MTVRNDSSPDLLLFSSEAAQFFVTAVDFLILRLIWREEDGVEAETAEEEDVLATAVSFKDLETGSFISCATLEPP